MSGEHAFISLVISAALAAAGLAVAVLGIMGEL